MTEKELVRELSRKHGLTYAKMREVMTGMKEIIRREIYSENGSIHFHGIFSVQGVWKREKVFYSGLMGDKTVCVSPRRRRLRFIVSDKVRRDLDELYKSDRTPQIEEREK